jgi:hypothetical protein
VEAMTKFLESTRLDPLFDTKKSITRMLTHL